MKFEQRHAGSKEKQADICGAGSSEKQEQVQGNRQEPA